MNNASLALRQHWRQPSGFATSGLYFALQEPDTELKIAIVGAGPWGTYAVERLAGVLRAAPPTDDVHIYIFDKFGRFGAGAVHDDRQVSTSYLNRTASQVSFGADESNCRPTTLLPKAKRPTLAEWAQAHYQRTGEARFKLEPAEVPPRNLHGAALREMFEVYIETLRAIPNITVHTLPTEVVDIEDSDDQQSSELVLRTIAGNSFAAHHVLLVTGHSTNRAEPGSAAWVFEEHAAKSGARYIDHVYPLDRQLTEAVVGAEQLICLLGMGLTAIDVILHLTEGRGGKFVGDEALTGPKRMNPQYLASGREPRIVVASPSGLFPRARPYNQKAIDASGLNHAAGEHKGVFLTLRAINLLRKRHGVDAKDSAIRVLQLDFGAHIFPLVVLEMAYVYYRTLLGSNFADRIVDVVQPFYDNFLERPGPDGQCSTDLLIDPIDRSFIDEARAPSESSRTSFLRFLDINDVASTSAWGHSADITEHRFFWRALFDPVQDGDAASPSEWRAKLISVMNRDIVCAEQGNLSNPVKAACDGVWRDLRATLSFALDFDGLTPDSHKEWIRVYSRYYNRMSNGASLVAMRKIVALMEADVVDVRLGPQPNVTGVSGAPRFHVSGLTAHSREVDVLISARAHPFSADLDTRPLYPNLLRRGIVRNWCKPRATGGFQPGALDVTSDFHPRRSDGSVDSRITILGAPTEGLVSFQLSAARPHSGSSILKVIGRWADEVVSHVRAHDRQRHSLRSDNHAAGTSD